MTDTRAEMLHEIEGVLARYLVRNTQWHESKAMITGFVFKVAGRVFDPDGETHRLVSWAALQDADSHTTLGLATALHSDVMAWYEDCTSEPYGGEDDDD